MGHRAIAAEIGPVSDAVEQFGQALLHAVSEAVLGCFGIAQRKARLTRLANPAGPAQQVPPSCSGPAGRT